MSASALAQARLLVRLREMRLTRAQRELAAARNAAERAEAEARAAAGAASDAAERLDDHRTAITTALDEAPTRIAQIDHSRFLHALAQSAANDAAEQRRLCAAAEQEQRRAMIQARTRRDVLADHSRGLAQSLAVTHEERLAVEIEEGRRS